MDWAAEGNDRMGKHVSSDSTSNYKIRFNDFWGRWTSLGVHGDPTVATAGKGELIFEAAVSGLVEAIDEIRAWPIEKRSDQHKAPVQSQIRW
jgi:creatinine amidohydrolase/Fe(II)-dependent formamide hydrolase-like protein